MNYKHITQENSDFYGLALSLSESADRTVFCDIETTGLDFRNPLERVLSFQIMHDDVVYIFDFTRLSNEHLSYLVRLLNDTKTKCVFFNAKFDLKFLYAKTGIMLENVIDTMNAEVLIRAGIGKSLYSLKDVAFNRVGVILEKESRDLFSSNDFSGFTEQLLEYAANDVYLLKPIYLSQLSDVEKARLSKVYELEMQLIPVVSKMEYDGVLLDKNSWSALALREYSRNKEITEKILEILVEEIVYGNGFENALAAAEALSIPAKTKKAKSLLQMLTTPEQIAQFVRHNFNVGSHTQLKSALNLIGIRVESTDQKVLSGYLNSHRVIPLLLEKSESSKRISTYGDDFYKYINPYSGRIHSEYLNMGAATGRFSSTSPNMQNIPTAKGYRESFVPSPGYKWISCDYSQQEYRLAGGISGESAIIDAYKRGADMHTATAAILFGKPLEEVTKDERSRGKSVNFAILYGSTEYGLKRNLGISLEEAKEIIDSFNKGYPKLSLFKRRAEEAILSLGYSSTPLGRRRYNEEKPQFMDSKEYMKYIAKVKREGFNHIIQGGGADIIKLAMVNIYKNNPFGEKFRLLVQVHDELDAEAEAGIAEEAAEFMKEEMLKAEQIFLGEVPAAVDVKIGDHWIH